MDSSPAWISEMRKHSMPLWVSIVEKLRLDPLINLFRHDTRHIPPGQRISNIEALAEWSAIHRLRRKAYNSEALISRSLFAVEDLAFNSIFIRANKCLQDIAKAAGRDLPETLIESMSRTEKALDQLWDEHSGLYFSRSFVSHKLVHEPTIACLLTLYSGSISRNRAQQLVALLKRRSMFQASWPVPSVPLSSPYFSPFKYWQGPSWVNTNWLIIEGLKNYGYTAEAKNLQDKTIKMVAKSGFYEYFNPLNGEPAGAPDFSWTAALTIDLLKN
jgi:neutral trehalase